MPSGLDTHSVAQALAARRADLGAASRSFQPAAARRSATNASSRCGNSRAASWAANSSESFFARVRYAGSDTKTFRKEGTDEAHLGAKRLAKREFKVWHAGLKDQIGEDRRGLEDRSSWYPLHTELVKNLVGVLPRRVCKRRVDFSRN
jgi:hypothetical protein